MDLSDATFATPQMRQGPTSRLLKRRSQAPPAGFQSPRAASAQKSVADSILGDVSSTGLDLTTKCSYDMTMAPTTNFTMATMNLDDLSQSVLNADETTYGETKQNPFFFNLKPLFSGAVPGLRATDNLYVDFLATITEETSGLPALDQVAELEELIAGHAKGLRDYAYKANKAVAISGPSNLSEVCTNFANERNTWRLLGRLFHDRLTPNDSEEETMSLAMARTSEKMLIRRLFRQDRALREGQIVVDWLELNARDVFDEKARLDYFAEGALIWENTLAVLNEGPGASYRRPIVSRLDPDAPRRENKPLHDLDAQDQTYLLKSMFHCIRAGLFESAQELCIKMGQSWRAAALEGWKLYHDPNYDEGDRPVDEKQIQEGNKNRDIWKKVVWKMIGDDKMSVYERAVFAPFCGNVGFLLGICNDWEDTLWAYAKCMVDLKVETEIRESMARSFAELPQEYWTKNRSNFEDIFTAIAASDSAAIRQQAANPYNVVQKYLILGELNVLLDLMDQWTTDGNHEEVVNDPHLLRFLAHVVIVLRRVVPADIDFEKGQSVLKQYVHYLISKDKIQQVAWYTAQLPVDAQIDLYAKFLESIFADSDRRMAIALADESNLPIDEIKCRVVQNVFAMETMANEAGDDDPELLVRRKIDVIGWLLYDERQRDEALSRTNALVRTLIAGDCFEAARTACYNVPEDSIPVITTRCTGGESEELTADQSNTIAEFLCWQHYFKAKESFEDWFDHFHKGKPVQPKLAPNPSFTEKVAHEEKSKQYAVDLERWQSNQEVQSREACDRLYATITFSGGWLVDRHDAESQNQRSLETDYLRKLCLPQLVLLLHSVLHNTGQYEKALQLADLVASEEHALYEVYVQDNMKELLSKLRESSLEAMATGHLDAFGHDVKV